MELGLSLKAVLVMRLKWQKKKAFSGTQFGKTINSELSLYFFCGQRYTSFSDYSKAGEGRREVKKSHYYLSMFVIASTTVVVFKKFSNPSILSGTLFFFSSPPRSAPIVRECRFYCRYKVAFCRLPR